jgi:hypothetical protein
LNTKALLSASAIVLGGAGIAGSFVPDQILRASALDPSPPVVLLAQLYAAVLFSWAMVNWTARGNLIGGIYNRAVAMGNVTHFIVGAFALIKALTGGRVAGMFVALALVYAGFAVAFGLVLVTSPVKTPESKG